MAEVGELRSAGRATGRAKIATIRSDSAVAKWTGREIERGSFRTGLYRFLVDQVPVVNACIWTWVRFSAAPGRFVVDRSAKAADESRGNRLLGQLAERIGRDPFGREVPLPTFLVELFTSLFRDGFAGGFLMLKPTGDGIDYFHLVDPSLLTVDTNERGPVMTLASGGRNYRVDPSSFRYIALGAGNAGPLGRSILRSIPFVAYIEQQLIDDMRRSSHNSGFHRLHVKVTPPERLAGEGEKAYVERLNKYFDDTVSMIQSCEIDDNPVTWNNVEIQVIGPSAAKSVTNSWFFNHRAMIEEVCAGTNLAPFLLGYSYGATTTWAAFKFDMVMRQVRSVQAEAKSLLETIGNVELALSGIDATCRFEFDNSFAYQAGDLAAVETSRVDTLLKLHTSGLIPDDLARRRASELLRG